MSDMTRPDIDALIEEGRAMIDDNDYNMTGWARQTIAALISERARANQAERVVEEVRSRLESIALNTGIYDPVLSKVLIAYPQRQLPYDGFRHSKSDAPTAE